MKRRAWLTCLAAGLTASVLLAEQSIVKTKDGNTYQGDLTTRTDDVVVTIHGVDTVIPKTDIDSIQQAEDLDKLYRDRLAALDAKDVNGRIALAREAFEKGRYDFARDTLQQTLTIEPNNPDANQLLLAVESKIKLEQTKGTPAPLAPTKAPLQGTRPNATLLSPADIEAIRKAELKPTDLGVRIQIDQAARRKFCEANNIAFAAFNNLPAAQEAVAMMDSGDPAMRDSVHVLTDPPSLLMYRREIQPMVIQNCATANCHGGVNGGKLVFPTAGDADPLTYTNFYILQQYQGKPKEAGGGGVFGSPTKGMIERNHALDSLLVNYALPVAVAKYDHPLVNGQPITPALRGLEDPRLALITNWMNVALVQTPPAYGIHYTPPSTQPASPTSP